MSDTAKGSNAIVALTTFYSTALAEKEVEIAKVREVIDRLLVEITALKRAASD